MELQVRKNSQYSFDLLKEASNLSLQQIFPLLTAWFVTLLGPVAVMGLGAFVGLLIDKIIFHSREAGLASVIGVGIPGLFICGFYAGWIYTTLRIARQEKTNLGHLFRPFSQMFSAAMVLILSTIATALPSFTIIGALVSPVIFLKFQLAPCFAVDQGLGPIQAMKRSWKETNRIWIPLAILDLCFFAISTALGFTFIIPFAVFMVQGVATALVYDRWVMSEELDELEMGD